MRLNEQQSAPCKASFALQVLALDREARKASLAIPAACLSTVSIEQCNSFGNVDASRTSCITTDTSSKLVGATHMRYDCSEKSFWVLTYVFQDFGFSQTVADMWINADCGACNSAAGAKEISYSGDANSGNCASSCSAATCSGSSCSVCCNDMWPVIDNGLWVGYLAKAHFGLPSGAVAAWDSVLVHWDWTSSPSQLTGGGTASSSLATGAPSACWQCLGKRCEGHLQAMLMMTPQSMMHRALYLAVTSHPIRTPTQPLVLQSLQHFITVTVLLSCRLHPSRAALNALQNQGLWG